MATIDIPIDDAFLPEAIRVIAIYLKYQDEILNSEGELIPNPDSKAITIKKEIYKFLRDMYEAGVNMELVAMDQAAKDQAKIDAKAGIGD